MVDLKGGDEARLTTVDDDGDPVWSPDPDGQQITFASRRDGNWEICVTDANGRNARRLTHDEDTDRFPSWSSDGRRIAFASNREGHWEIYAIDAEGGLDRI